MLWKNEKANGRRATILTATVERRYKDKDGNDFTSLVLATDVDGRLKYVGTVSRGFSTEVREELNQRLEKIPRTERNKERN